MTNGKRKMTGEIGLLIHLFSVAYPNNENGSGSFIRFVNDSIIAVSERITTLFITFKRFAGVGIWGERIYAF
jgi:hypothetical protein